LGFVAGVAYASHSSASNYQKNATRMSAFYIGTAGWAIPRDSGREFHGTGTHLQRYSRIFTAVEINSTFRRPHKRSTYERWAADAPAGGFSTSSARGRKNRFIALLCQGTLAIRIRHGRCYASASGS
jgi:hypothetical protein